MDVDVGVFETTSGKKYPCPFFSVLPQMGIAYVGVSDMSWADASALFQDESEMEHLTYAGQTFDGYTHLDYIMAESYGLKAQLSKPRG
jgi:hypothetical protein